MNKNFIHGKLVDPTGDEICLRQYRNGQFINCDSRESSSIDLELAIRSAESVSEEWSNYSRRRRLEIIELIIKGLEDSRTVLAKSESECAGKKFTDALAEVDVGISHWRFARSSLEVLSEHNFSALENNTHGLIRSSPVGLVGLITPYNFPIVVLCERLPYLLAAGCTALIKPSEIASSSTVLLGKILFECGLPAGVVNIVQGRGESIGQAIVTHDAVRMISFTGSTGVGRLINCAAAKHFKRVSLELGGNNPAIIDEDANINQAVAGIIAGFTYHAGQCCISTNRVFVHKKIKGKLIARLIDQVALLKDTVDPIFLETQYKRLDAFRSMLLGMVDPIYQGRTEKNDIQMICPMIFERGAPDDTEIFGPLLFLEEFEELNDAISRANKTKFGLAAVYYGFNVSKIEYFVKKINAGRLWINGSMKSLTALSLGGIKESGIGKEAGFTGIQAYLEYKAVVYNF